MLKVCKDVVVVLNSTYHNKLKLRVNKLLSCNCTRVLNKVYVSFKVMYKH